MSVFVSSASAITVTFESLDQGYVGCPGSTLDS